MDVLDLLRHEARKAYAWLETNVSDVTPAQAAWRPPGIANSIASTYAHAMISADVDLSRHFYGRDPVIADGWGERLGLAESFPDDWPADVRVDWTSLRAYGSAVRERVEALADALTMDDLERRFEMRALVTTKPGNPPELKSLGLWKGIDIFTLHLGGHIWMHGGEIACLKGLQGSQGYRRFLMNYT